MKRLIVGITGASAGIYGVRLLEVLTKHEDIEVHLTISASGARALSEELQIEVDLNNFELASLIGISSPRVIYHHESDIAAPIASGSFRTEGMIVVPCSMGASPLLLTVCRVTLSNAPRMCASKKKRPLVLGAARDTAQPHSLRKHAQTITPRSLCSTCDARVLSLSQKCR